MTTLSVTQVTNSLTPYFLPCRINLDAKTTDLDLKTIDTIINKYLERQQDDNNSKNINMLHAPDDSGSFSVRGVGCVRQLTDPAEFGFLEHYGLTSSADLKLHLESTQKIDSLIIRAHSKFIESAQTHSLLMKPGRVGRHLAYWTLGYLVTLACVQVFNPKWVKHAGLSTSVAVMWQVLGWCCGVLGVMWLSPRADRFDATLWNGQMDPSINSIVLVGCGGGALWRGREGCLTGTALELARRNPGVEVTGASCDTDQSFTYQYSRDPKTGVLKCSITNQDNEKVSHTYCIQRHIKYNCCQTLIRAAAAAASDDMGQDAKHLAHLIQHSALSIYDLNQTYQYCVKKKTWACSVKVFENSPIAHLLSKPKDIMGGD